MLLQFPLHSWRHSDPERLSSLSETTSPWVTQVLSSECVTEDCAHYWRTHCFSAEAAAHCWALPKQGLCAGNVCIPSIPPLFLHHSESQYVHRPLETIFKTQCSVLKGGGGGMGRGTLFHCTDRRFPWWNFLESHLAINSLQVLFRNR